MKQVSKVNKIIIIFLLCAVVCFAQTYEELSDSEKIDYLKNNFGVTANPNDITIEGNKLVITGDASLISKQGLDVHLDGGSVIADSYSGSLSIDTFGGSIKTKDGFFEFGSGGKVTLVNGVITKLEGVKPKGNIVLNSQSLSTNGLVTFDSSSGLLKSSDSLLFNEFSISGNGTNDLELKIKKDSILLNDPKREYTLTNNRLGATTTIRGRAELFGFYDIALLPAKGETSYLNTNVRSITVSKPTRFPEGFCDVVTDVSCVQQFYVGGRDLKIVLRDNNIVQLSSDFITTKTIQVNKITDDSKLTVKQTKSLLNPSEGIVIFSKNAPVTKGDISNFPQIITKYDIANYVWRLEDGATSINDKSSGLSYLDRINFDAQVSRLTEVKSYEAIIKYKKDIDEYAKELGVDTNTILSIIYVEYTQYELNLARKYKSIGQQTVSNVLYSVNLKEAAEFFNKGLQLSSGFTHIKPKTAEDTKHKLDNIPGFKDYITYDDITNYQLQNDIGNKASIKITAGMLKVLQEQWKNSPEGVDISQRPEILATLYNIGYERSVPKKNPQAGGTYLPTVVDGKYIENTNFGVRVSKVYNSRTMDSFFPKKEEEVAQK